MNKKLFSHPDKLLKDHLQNVYQIGDKKLKEVDPPEKIYKNIDISLNKFNAIILLTHDFAKATSFFQRKLYLAVNKPDSREYQKLLNDSRTNHGRLSAFYTYFILSELSSNPIVPILGLMIVNRHHGNLKNAKDNFLFLPEDWDVLFEQEAKINNVALQEILETNNILIDLDEFSVENIKDYITHYRFKRKVLKEAIANADINTYYLVNLLYSILVFSDKAEVIFYKEGLESKTEEILFNREELNPGLVDNYRQMMGWDQPQNQFDQLRATIYQDVMKSVNDIDSNNRILSINVPTGTGKTVASYSAAFKLRDKLDRDYRIIYTLPFTSIIEQNYGVMKDILKEEYSSISSEYLIRHHHLTERNYETEENDNISYSLSEFLIESWNSEIVISTFVQLLESILSNNNRRMKKYNNIAHSIIILDEVQAIPHKYWLLIKRVLQDTARIFDCYFILVTATMPLIFNETKGEIKELATGKEKYFSNCNRIELNLELFREEMTINQFEKKLENDLRDNYPEKSFLIILNTIKSSVEVYKYLKEELDYNNIIYLSKNIINRDLRERIKTIREGKQNMIVVSTQLVEAGVDIDFDIVYRDYAPLDSINQSCGRCNRNYDPDKKGLVKLIRLVDEDNKNMSYASYIYSSYLLNNTLEVLQDLPDRISEKSFFEFNKEYFSLVDAEKSNDQSNDLLKWIENLQYENAFENGKNYEIFRLIRQKYETVDLFIAIDEDADELWELYLELSDINDPWQRKAFFEEFKEDFLDYVVTVSKTNFLKHFSDDRIRYGYNYIGFEEIENVYEIETGFIPNVQNQYFI